MENNKPWWVPDTAAFLAISIVVICGIALFYRMSRPSVIDDKMLETMLTILFSTCLVAVYNYSYGSSRGSQAKDDTQNKIVEKLTANSQATPPVGQPGSITTTAQAPAEIKIETEKPK